MRRVLLVGALLFTFEAEAHAFWGALVRGAAKAGKATSSAGKAAGAAKVAKPAAVGAAAGGLADDASRGVGRAGALGEDATHAGGGAARHADESSGGGSTALDVASNAGSFAGEDAEVEEDEAEAEHFQNTLVGVGVLVVLGFALIHRRRARSR